MLSQTTKKVNVTMNAEKNGIEVSFAKKPEASTLSALKSAGFRWHNVKRLWYATKTPERVALSEKLFDGEPIPEAVTETETRAKQPKTTAVKINKFGVKVGDLFSATWGYDQTNNDFFQVVALVGECSVRVRQVYPKIKERTARSWASEDYTIENDGELLEPAPYSVFIRDQENGDLKRLKSYAADGKSSPEFNLSSFANAYFVPKGASSYFESSWA